MCADGVCVGQYGCANMVHVCVAVARVWTMRVCAWPVCVCACACAYVWPRRVPQLCVCVGVAYVRVRV